MSCRWAKAVTGEKIRRQYFRVPIFLLLLIWIGIAISLFFTMLAQNHLDISKWVQDIGVGAKVCIVFALPFLILSILNDHFFGKVLCVVNQEGIFGEQGFVGWDETQKIEYEIDFPTKAQMKSSYVRIVTQKENIEISHMPLRFLRKARKYDPKIPVSISKSSKWTLGIMAAELLAAAIILPFAYFA